MTPPGTGSAPLLDALQAAANRAASEETAFRRESAQRIQALERGRSVAFRRLKLMQDVARFAERAESEELAVAGCIAILQTKLGWSSDSEARSEILSRFGGIAKAIFAQAQPEPEVPEPDVLAVLSDFEAWYAAQHGAAFWDLFDQPMLETPLVDF
jgi:hypothetical protein